MLTFENYADIFTKAGLPVEKSEFTLFDRYASMLADWNSRVNLTSITAPDEIIMKHFADSLLLTKFVNFPDGCSVIDVGSGAGFPGLPLKIHNNNINMTFLDSLQKRLAFLDAVCAELNLPCERLHMRAEDAGRNEQCREKYDIATARAVARMDVLAEYCLPLVKVGGVFAALKGPNEDISASKTKITQLGGKVSFVENYSLPNGDARMLVLIEKISHTPTKYPRTSAALAKEMKNAK